MTRLILAALVALGGCKASPPGGGSAASSASSSVPVVAPAAASASAAPEVVLAPTLEVTSASKLRVRLPELSLDDEVGEVPAWPAGCRGVALTSEKWTVGCAGDARPRLVLREDGREVIVEPTGQPARRLPRGEGQRWAPTERRVARPDRGCAGAEPAVRLELVEPTDMVAADLKLVVHTAGRSPAIVPMLTIRGGAVACQLVGSAEQATLRCGGRERCALDAAPGWLSYACGEAVGAVVAGCAKAAAIPIGEVRQAFSYY